MRRAVRSSLGRAALVAWAALALLPSLALGAPGPGGSASRATPKRSPSRGSADGGTRGLTSGARPVEIDSDRLEVFGKRNQAVYTGNARARRGGTAIRCEQLVVTYVKGGSDVSRIEARGGVEVEDTAGRWARGDQADFDNLTGVLVVTGKPEARQGANHVAGSTVRFLADSDLIEVDEARTRLESERAAGTPGGGTPAKAAASKVQIDADKLRIRQSTQQAEWTGHVRARRGTALITSERLLAFYGQDQEVSRLEARGNVEVVDADRWARGEKADFDNKTGVLVVTGSPVARQGASIITGTKVTFTVGKELIEVENARTVTAVPRKGDKASDKSPGKGTP